MNVKIKIVVALIVICLVASNTLFSQQRKLDSLEKILTSKQDTARITILLELCWEYRNTELDKAFKFGDEAIRLLESEKVKSKKQISQAYNYMGVVYRNMGDYPAALDFYFKSLKKAEEIGDFEQMGYAYQTIGNIYNRQGNYKEAILNVDKSLAIFEKLKHQRGLAYCYYIYGQIYQKMKDFKPALDNLYKSLDLRKKLKDKGSYASSMLQLGVTYQAMKNYEKAFEFYNKALGIFKKIEDYRNTVVILSKKVEIFILQSKTDSALYYSTKGLEIAEKQGIAEYAKENAHNLSRIFAIQDDYEKAYKFQTLYFTYNDTLSNLEVNNKFQSLHVNYEKNKVQYELQLLKSESQRQAYIRNTFIVAFIMISLLAFIFYRNYKERVKANKLLTEQKHEIEQKNDELYRINRNITSSINYAKRIQTAMLPFPESFSRAVDSFFIFYRPRDIVSGDFYYINHKKDKVVIVVADCTGHGVPGAFMSMIGSQLLTHIIAEKNILEPHEIVKELNIGIRHALQQDQTNNSDGMDVAVVTYNFQTKILEYAGALNSIILFKNEEMIELKADKYSIGGIKRMHEKNFTLQTMVIDQPTQVYMYTDGYRDQISKLNQRKMTAKRFKEILQDIHTSPMSAQSEMLEKKLDDWRSGFKQLDDVTVVGFEIS